METTNITSVNGILLTPDSIDAIRYIQEYGVDDHIDILEKMIDYMIIEGDVPHELDSPRVRLENIQALRFLEKLIVTFKHPQKQ